MIEGKIFFHVIASKTSYSFILQHILKAFTVLLIIV
jgi:hypothetical protein